MGAWSPLGRGRRVSKDSRGRGSQPGASGGGMVQAAPGAEAQEEAQSPEARAGPVWSRKSRERCEEKGAPEMRMGRRAGWEGGAGRALEEPPTLGGVATIV